jgi:hypothetical protein
MMKLRPMPFFGFYGLAQNWFYVNTRIGHKRTLVLSALIEPGFRSSHRREEQTFRTEGSLSLRLIRLRRKWASAYKSLLVPIVPKVPVVPNVLNGLKSLSAKGRISPKLFQRSLTNSRFAPRSEIVSQFIGEKENSTKSKNNLPVDLVDMLICTEKKGRVQTPKRVKSGVE